MEFFFLILIVLVLLCIVLPIWSAQTAKATKERMAILEEEVRVLKRDIAVWRRTGEGPPPVKLPVKSESPPPLPPSVRQTPNAEPVAAKESTLPAERLREPVVAQKVLPGDPPPLLSLKTSVSSWTPTAQKPPGKPFQFEQFLGKKLFAWVGGLGLFIGVLLLVKYAFEAGWFPPAARVTMGFVMGVGLLIGGLRIRREELRVLAHTLSATGILVLYGVTFAAHGVYHFSAFSTVPAFALMSLITAVAFMVALRLPALTVAVLGLLGGFLTPILLSTGEDRPIALFGYLALLDAGLLLLAVRGRWPFLAALAAGATMLMQVEWMSRYFEMGRYFEGGATFIPLTVSLGFGALFSGAAAVFKRRKGVTSGWLGGAASGVWAVALLMGFQYLSYEEIALRPWLIFGYLLLANAGAIHASGLLPEKGWRPQVVAGLAGCTALFQAGWLVQYFESGGYAEGAATLVPMAVAMGFAGLFTGLAVWENRKNPDGGLWTAVGAFGLWVAAILSSFYFLGFGSVALRPWLLYGFLFVANAGALYAARLGAGSKVMPRLAGAITFGHLAIWLLRWMTPESLGTGLALIFFFAVLNSVVPLMARRWRGVEDMQPLAPWAPVAGIVLTLLVMVTQPMVSILVWPVIVVMNLAVLFFVSRGQRLLILAISTVLTLISAFVWAFRIEVSPGGLREVLAISGLFAVFFTGGGAWLLRKGQDKEPVRDGMLSQSGLTAVTGGMPYLLLLMSVLRFPVPDPSMVFGLSLVLGVVLLGLARWFRLPVLAPVAAGCMLAVEGVWWAGNFRSGLGDGSVSAPLVLVWFAVATGLFLAWPFTHRGGAAGGATWLALALSTIGQGLLTYVSVRVAWPEAGAMGLVPAGYAVIMMAVLLGFLRTVPGVAPHRMASLAWVGGTALLFITLIFPAQFQRHWLTIGWAMEGAALCWLYRRVKHPGLIPAAALLLGAAFVRLVLNPAVIQAYDRDGTPVWNWLLYTYGLAAASHFLAARWLPQEARLDRVVLRPVLTGMGGVLLFVLLNLEIADWFTRPDMRTIDLKNHGVFAQSMITSIGWALFAIVTLALGLWRGAPVARYAGAGLLAVTLTKLFVHDLRAMESIYRIAAFIGVSVMTLFAAWLYQRYLNPSAVPSVGGVDADESKPEISDDND